jgi:hypothetical protein
LSCMPYVACVCGLSCMPYVACVCGLFCMPYVACVCGLSCMPYVACVCGLSILGCPFGFLCLFKKYLFWVSTNKSASYKNITNSYSFHTRYQTNIFVRVYIFTLISV